MAVTERERETETETDRQTDRDRQTGRQAGRQAGRDIETVSVRKLSRHVVVSWSSSSFDIWQITGGGGHLKFSSRDGGDGYVM